MGGGAWSSAETSPSEACLPASRATVSWGAIRLKAVKPRHAHIADDRPVRDAHRFRQARGARAEREESQFCLLVFRLQLELGREGLLLGRSNQVVKGWQTLGRLADVRRRRGGFVYQDDQFRRNIRLFARLHGGDGRIRVDENRFDRVVLVNYAGQAPVSQLGSKCASFGEFSFCAASPILSWCANSSAL